MPVSTWSSPGFDGAYQGCTLRVMDSNQIETEGDPGITLGLIFLRQFTLAFDQEADKLQIAVSRFASEGVTDGKTIVKPEPKPKPSDSRIGNGILIVVIIVLTFILIISCIWYVAKQSKSNTAERNLQAAAYGETSSNSSLIYGTETPDTRSKRSRLSTEQGVLLKSRLTTIQSEGSKSRYTTIQSEGNLGPNFVTFAPQQTDFSRTSINSGLPTIRESRNETKGINLPNTN